MSLVRFALVSNLNFAATRDELMRWFASKLEDKTSILSVMNDSHTSPTLSLSAHGSNNAVNVPRADHNGRAYIEFCSNQVLEEAIAICNEKEFAGRPIKMIRAWRRGGVMYLLQTPAHMRFFFQHASPSRENSPDGITGKKVVSSKPKQFSVDGGFNWGP